MDDCDLSSMHEAASRRRAIDEARGMNTPTLGSRTTCMDCGGRIPEARRRAQPGCCRCVDCQTAYEEADT